MLRYAILQFSNTLLGYALLCHPVQLCYTMQAVQLGYGGSGERIPTLALAHNLILGTSRSVLSMQQRELTIFTWHLHFPRSTRPRVSPLGR